jgi:3-phosphoshikimate 1-carboxyvinyltransferase
MATCRCLTALAERQSVLDCGESGTTLRLIVPLAASLDPHGLDPSGSGQSIHRADRIRFIGRGRLPKRPLDTYRTVLSDAGARLDFPDQDSLPLELSGTIHPGLYRIPGHISSQYLSGLLFALPLLPGDSQIELTSALESAPYVAMTLRTLAHFGITIHQSDRGFDVPGRQTYQQASYTVEKDFSQAAFWLTAACLGSELTVAGLPDGSAQGDRAIVDLLADFCRCQPHYAINAAQIPDLVPILAVAAAATPALTRITHAARLRYKESDRLESTAALLRAIGIQATATEDELQIQGTDRCGRQDSFLFRGGTVDSQGDHRIAMAAAIAALRTEQGIVLRHAEVVQKSYPDFFDQFRRLGGRADELDLGT